MSLPPGFLDELRSRTSLAQVVGRKVTWDPRKSNRGKGDFWAPCPFHNEKTASFHVDDKKGFYYCFGCQAKGDAIGFVTETENVSFMEAIEILAREAGMQIPARDPQAQRKADRRTQLAQVMEEAVKWFRLQLRTGQAAEARSYLAGRGLAEDAQDRWELGFAPPRGGLFAALTAKGHAADLLIDAGLAAKSDRGGSPYDRFRNRIIFPIRDARGTPIAFGGRAMDPNDRAKYLNSPETELFDKGRSLYNHGPARTAAGKAGQLIVAEGYMDVIALSEAGFAATVAPLGTAVTESQLQLLWRIHDEPVIALDGDAAGLRAAMRVIDLALPLLEAGRSLRFAVMPEGQDPDDLIRAGGAGAMQKVLDTALPMVRLLWQRETEGRVFDSPERRAALDRDLRVALQKIQDRSLRRHYADEIGRLRRELFNPPRPGRARTPWQPRGKFAPPQGPEAATRTSLLASGQGGIEESLREAVILAGLLTRPGLLMRFEGDLERLELSSPDHARIRDALLRHATLSGDEIRAAVAAAVGMEALENLFAPRHVVIAPAVRRENGDDIAAACLAEEMGKLAAHRAQKRELEELGEWGDAADEELTWRLGQAAEARHRAERGHTEDRAEYETGPNGAHIRREERDALDALLARIRSGETG
ncbi:DNA primase [Mesobaculum littorinae]|uniref:DNA primase n=1 Tax=Mesobaculum littorinae TaxID=2486419 RepID=A0A438ALF0_9RHOB|nr:DNA primase [Mesobaculum littorinae]RVV99499.1 DNA primase [Mesobaculum littorinae]